MEIEFSPGVWLIAGRLIRKLQEENNTDQYMMNPLLIIPPKFEPGRKLTISLHKSENFFWRKHTTTCIGILVLHP